MIAKLKTTIVCTLLSLTQLAAAAGKIAFQPEKSYSVGTSPVWVVTGDFNNDGKRDLAVINQGNANVGDPGGVSVLLGNGDGTFQPAKNIAIGKNCTSAVAGDFDGDGNDDLVLVRPGDASVNDDGDVTIFLGNGDGTFRQGQVLTPGKNPSFVAAADFNGDQRLDLVVLNSGGSTFKSTFDVMLGNGNGTFQTPVAYTELYVAQSIFVVDLAGNGEKDLVVFSVGVDTWLGNGDGTFRQGPPSQAGGFGILLGDFDEDKKVDLVTIPSCVFNCGRNYPRVQLGNGDGTFQPAISIGQKLIAAAAGDFDGDGKLDLAADGSATQLQILQGNGDGTFQPPTLVAGSGAPALYALDVNGDNAPDLVTTGNNTITVLLNVGTDFSISASTLDPNTLSVGQSATSSLTLKLLSNFNNPVSLACAVEPAQPGAPKCSLSSNSVTFDANGDSSSTLTISVGSNAALCNSLQPFSRSSLLWLPAAGFAFLWTGFGVRPRNRRSLFVVPIATILFIGIIMQTACGGGGNSSGPKSTAYTVTITGTAGATQHSTTVNVTVDPS